MSKETGKKISMELTAEGARVTSLKLEGSRLVLTIEAELSEASVAAETSVAEVEPEKVRPVVPPPASAPEQPRTISFGDPLPDAFAEIETEEVPQPFTAQPSFAAQPQPPEPAGDTVNVWDNSFTAANIVEPVIFESAPAPAFAQPLDFSLSEEASVLGGARHGEPQAPAFDMPVLNFADEPKQMQMPEPLPEPMPIPAQTQTPPPVSSTPQFATPMPLPDFSLENPGAAMPTSASTPPPPPAPAPMPAPEEAPAPSPRPEAGGTTVLIRYTCPKCKTQGMQAVDKVGAVVNCSNCGKAMRLVMKK